MDEFLIRLAIVIVVTLLIGVSWWAESKRGVQQTRRAKRPSGGTTWNR